jgi:hypothetical protein
MQESIFDKKKKLFVIRRKIKVGEEMGALLG